ncbi:MAG TPA: hypothetical protein VFH66_12770 [Mycobacteriales bacterium]|nr:hypothetical protein [Mycobacteriales bacterium]
MRIRAAAVEAGFLALLATFVTVPTLGLGQHASGIRAEGAAGGSGNGSSGSTSGGSGGSGSSSGGSSSTNTSSPPPQLPTALPTPTLGLPSSPAAPSSTEPTPSRSTPAPQPSQRTTTSPPPPPPVGTIVETTVASLPPFLLLACLIGVVAGADALPAAQGLEAAHATAAACSNVHVSKLNNGFGLSSNTTRHPKPKDVHLTIRIRGPSSNPQIFIQQHLAPSTDNKFLLTLLAALVILAVAIAVAYAVRQRRTRAGPA